MNRFPQRADAFPVNDPHLQDPSLPAGFEIVGDKLLYVLRLEGVQVKDAVDRLFKGRGHDQKSNGLFASFAVLLGTQWV